MQCTCIFVSNGTYQIRRITKMNKMLNVGPFLGYVRVRFSSAFKQFTSALTPLWIRFVSALRPLFGISFMHATEVIRVNCNRPLFVKKTFSNCTPTISLFRSKRKRNRLITVITKKPELYLLFGKELII